MMLRRPLRRWVSGWFVLMIVFSQILTAAYACPQVGIVEPTSGASMARMPCASEPMRAELDPAQPGLCLQHCQYGSNQAFSDASSSQPHPGPAYAVVVFPAPVAVAPAAVVRDRDRERAPPPTHAVLHCCLRL